MATKAIAILNLIPLGGDMAKYYRLVHVCVCVHMHACAHACIYVYMCTCACTLSSFGCIL